MDTLIVYIDDAAYARQMLTPLLDAATPTRWVLVACAPRMSHRIGKWLSHSARESWRSKWCDRLFSQIAPDLQSQHEQALGSSTTVAYVIAKGPLPELTRQLHANFGTARVVDARRPKFGQALEPVTLEQQCENNGWQIPTAVGSLSALLVLAAE